MSEQISKFTTFQKSQEENSLNLSKHEDEFKKKMNMTSGMIIQIQDFINKVERRVLRLEHVILTPFWL